jgi:hypothetical protein
MREGDAGNSHLRGGVVAGFGLVRAIGAGDILQVRGWKEIGCINCVSHARREFT